MSLSLKSAFVLSSSLTPENLLVQCRNLLTQFLLPEGFPNSFTSDYLDYSLWRGVQGIASQISGVLATQLGWVREQFLQAAAINWVLKDGIGYLSKIMLSKYGRHFDVHPKGWRLFADLLENSAYGMEKLTPLFPQFFVLIGVAAGAGRSAAPLIQAATRSCFNAGFASQRNFAEVHYNFIWPLPRSTTILYCKPGGRLQFSLDYVRREFEHAKEDSASVGWVTEGLIARPLPNRIRLGYDLEPSSSPSSS